MKLSQNQPAGPVSFWHLASCVPVSQMPMPQPILWAPSQPGTTQSCKVVHGWGKTSVKCRKAMNLALTVLAPIAITEVEAIGCVDTSRI